MGKYSGTNFRAPKAHVEHPHPIWRGIGCIMMIIIPIISFAMAEFTVQNTWAQQYIPYQLLGYVVVPAKVWKVGFLNPVLTFIQNQANLYGVLIFFLFYLLVLGSLMSIINAYLYKSFAPSRFGPQDAPPPKIKVRT